MAKKSGFLAGHCGQFWGAKTKPVMGLKKSENGHILGEISQNISFAITSARFGRGKSWQKLAKFDLIPTIRRTF